MREILWKPPDLVRSADTPRNVVVCRALQARWGLAAGANVAEDPDFVWEISQPI